MGLIRYFFILLLTVISFFGVSLMILNTGPILFIKELYLLLFLLIIAGIALFSAGRNQNSGWMLFALFFGTIIINSLYLFETVRIGKGIMFAVLFSALIGLIMSIYFIRPRYRRRRPRIDFDDVVTEADSEEEIEVVAIPKKKPKKKKKKTVKKTAKKTVKKKKKTAKKKTAKKRARKITRKKAA